MTHPRASLLVLLQAGLAACGLVGCGSGGWFIDPDASTAADGGVPRSDGGAGSDGGIRTHPDADMGPMAPTTEGALSALTPGDYGPTQLASCYDGLDNDGNGLSDCQDVGCGALASCCPGPGTSCCDAPTDLSIPVFAACSGTLVGCPLAGVTLFGTGLPHADASGLYPGGDHTNEGGLLLDAPLDRTQATFVTGTLAIPAPADCGVGCIDSVALGLLTDTSLGATSAVRPVVALVASASLQQVMLVSGDVVLASTPAPAADGSPFAVAFTYTAAGRVTADVAGVALSASVPRAASALHLAVYGHNENRSGVPSSRVLAVTAAQRVCDVPSVWATRDLVIIGAGASTAPQVVEGPSVASSTTDAYLAFAAGDGVYVARRAVGTTPTSFAMQFGYGTPELAGASLADPDIHFVDGTSPTWRVYVANRTTGGIEATGAPDAAPLAFDPLVPVLSPSDPIFAGEFDALDGPSVALPGAGGRTDYVLAVRARSGATSSIVLLHSADGLTAWEWIGADRLSSTVTPPSGLGGPAHDELGTPSLVHRDGAWDLYYAGRTFARWSIGLMLSDDLTHWRSSPTPTVLAGTDRPSAFDAFSVRDPGLAFLDGDAGHVELFYAGTDGVATRIGRVSRSATTVRGP